MVEKNSTMFSVFPILYHNDEFGYSHRKGTGFSILYKNRLFAVTASHCIENDCLTDIIIGQNPSEHKSYSLPISAQIKINYTDGVNIDSDARIFEIDMKQMFENIKANADIPSVREISNRIAQTPLIKRLKRIYKNNPEKGTKKIRQTTLFNTMFNKFVESFLQALRESDSSLVDSGHLKLGNNHLQKGDMCIAAGYPTKHIGINTDDETGNITEWKFSYKEIWIRYIGQNPTTHDDLFLYDGEDDLDGFSGGPIFDSKKSSVLGVMSSVKKETENIICVTPHKTIANALDNVILKTPDPFDLNSDSLYKNLFS